MVNLINVSDERMQEIVGKIDKLKIADSLSEKNPLKKFMYNIENQTNPGIVYKTFCVLCIIYIMVIHFVAILQHNLFSWAIVPLSVWGLATIYACFKGCFFYKTLKSELLSALVIVSYFLIIATTFSMIDFDKNDTKSLLGDAFPVNHMISNNICANYGITIAVLVFSLVLLNNTYLVYVRQTFVSLVLNFSLFSKILFSLFGLLIVYAGLTKGYEDMILANHIGKAVFLTSGISVLIICLTLFFSLSAFRTIRLSALKINNFYK